MISQIYIVQSDKICIFDISNTCKVMEETRSSRGGKRDGAGRKATGRTKKTITLCLSYDVVELLNAHSGNKSAYIESLIRADALSK